MTEARIEEVPADRVTAREYLDQGRRFLEDAARNSNSNESRQLLFHQAALCACDAILLARRRRVSSGDAAHVMRLRAALAELAGDTDDLLDALDAARAMRVEASYGAFLVPDASLADATEATLELYARAAEVVEG